MPLEPREGGALCLVSDEFIDISQVLSPGFAATFPFGSAPLASGEIMIVDIEMRRERQQAGTSREGTSITHSKNLPPIHKPLNVVGEFLG